LTGLGREGGGRERDLAAAAAGIRGPDIKAGPRVRSRASFG